MNIFREIKELKIKFNIKLKNINYLFFIKKVKIEIIKINIFNKNFHFYIFTQIISLCKNYKKFNKKVKVLLNYITYISFTKP